MVYLNHQVSNYILRKAMDIATYPYPDLSYM